jgi:hypothetical protein
MDLKTLFLKVSHVAPLQHVTLLNVTCCTIAACDNVSCCSFIGCETILKGGKRKKFMKFLEIRFRYDVSSDRFGSHLYP